MFAKESLSGTAPFTVLSKPTVYLIFWGTGWGAGQTPGPSSVTNLTVDAQSIINSPYFNGGLNEYGNIGSVSYGGAWTDSSAQDDPGASFDPGVPGASRPSRLRSPRRSPSSPGRHQTARTRSTSSSRYGTATGTMAKGPMVRAR